MPVICCKPNRSKNKNMAIGNHNHNDANTLFLTAQSRDKIGDRFHIAFAFIWAAMITLGTAPFAIMSLILAVYAILRIWATAPTYPGLIKTPVFIILTAALIWSGLSLLWSSNITQGLDEFKIFRLQIPVLLGLWPVLNRSKHLLLAVCLSASLAAIAQILQRCGLHFGWYDIYVPNRYPGFLHPSNTTIIQVITGILALGWLFTSSKALQTRSHKNDLVLNTIGLTAILLLSITGIILAGSRAAWLVTAISWPVAAGTSIWKLQSANKKVNRSNKKLASAVITFLVICGITFPFFVNDIKTRIQNTQNDFQALRDTDNYKSDVGGRIYQFPVAWQIFKAHPLAGVGLGAYQNAGEQIIYNKNINENSSKTESEKSYKSQHPVYEHPHSALMYTLSTTGIPGILIYLLFWIILFRQSLISNHSINTSSPAIFNTSTSQILCNTLPIAVLALFLLFTLDSHNLSAPGTSLLMIITATTIPTRFSTIINN